MDDELGAARRGVDTGDATNPFEDMTGSTLSGRGKRFCSAPLLRAFPTGCNQWQAGVLPLGLHPRHRLVRGDVIPR